MAFIDGPSLADKIKERPLPLDEALRITIQIAEGLHEAHEKGIIHRDIKPHNVMLTAKGQVKIMDFGLASLAGRSKITKSGTTLGTPAYMAPEQLEAEEVDRRADIWALGCVLYEMLVQRSPFEADYEQAVAYGILNEEPEPVSAQRSDVGPEIDRLIGKALRKSAGDRYQNVDDLLVDARGVLQGERRARGSTASGPEARTPHWPLAAALAVSLLAAALFGFTWLRSSDGPQQPERVRRSFAITPQAPALWPTISPDGRYVAYLSVPEDGRVALWVHDLAEGSDRILAGPDNAIWNKQPFWSPDGGTLVFRIGDELAKVSVGGGPTTSLSAFRSGVGPFGGSWSPDGENLLVADYLITWQIPAEGGEPERFLEWPRDERIRYGWPSFLPSESGERKLLYVEIHDLWDAEIVAHDLRTGRRVTLANGYRPSYSPSGHIVYRRRDPAEIWAVPFSAESLQATGPPFLVRQNASRPSVANDGTLIYVEQAAMDLWAGVEQLRWRDREGRIIGTVGQPQEGTWDPALSPDEQRVAVRGHESGPWADIWIHDAKRPIKTRFTTDDSNEWDPIWSPSGDRIAFSSGLAERDIYTKPSDGSGAPIALVTSDDAREVPTDWGSSPSTLVFTRQTSTEGGGRRDWNIWYARTGEGARPEQRLFLGTEFREAAGQLSPDGSVLAYVSDESGRSEVYLRSFPSGRNKRQVSVRGGGQPRWRGDGKEIFFVEETMLMAVSLSTGASEVLGSPEPLFSSEGLRAGGFDTFRYDVTRDGQRFVLRESAEEGADQIRVVLNWYEEFRDRE